MPTGPHSLSVNWPATSSVFKNRIKLDLKEQEHRYFSINHAFKPTDAHKYPRRIEWTNYEMLNVIEMNPADAQTVIQKLGL